MTEYVESLELPYNEPTKRLSDYLSLLRRQKKSIIVTSFVSFIVFVLIAFLWPPTYRSSATILIEEQDIPADFVRSTVTSYVAQRIEVINAQVMTRSNLMGLIEKHNLYPHLRNRETRDELIERMREDTNRETVSADVIDPRSGRPTTATIAFTLSFEGRNPQTVLQVTNELATLYLNENLKKRAEQAEETSAFLGSEAGRLRDEISESEGKLAEFKKLHGEKLPEFKQINFQLMERIDQEITSTDNQLRALQERKFYLEGQLAQINPGGPVFSSTGERVMGPEDRLSALQTEFLRISNLYHPDHPDLVKMRREIGSLERSVEGAGASGDQAKRLTNLRAELIQKKDRYKEGHPEITKLIKSISALEKRLSENPLPISTRSILAQEPDNPAYITLNSQLDSVRTDIRATRALLLRHQEKRANIENRLLQSPQVEREYLEISRDYENALMKYREIKSKLTEANISQELERERKGERFSLIDPPGLPEEPIKPNRIAILFLGFIISGAIGFGQTFVRDALDGSAHTPDEIKTLLGKPPLAVVPLHKTAAELSMQKRKQLYTMSGVIVAIILLLVLVHFLYSPLDVLWFRIERKIGQLFIF